MEILVSLDAEDINEDAKHRLDEFNKLGDDVQAALKKNSAINIEGQLKIIEIIEANLVEYEQTLVWNTYPNYDKLAAVIGLAWDYLMKPGENKADIRNSKQLAVLALKYSRLGSVTALINDTVNDQFYIGLYPDLQVRIDKVTFFILNVTRHWFDYKLPKWISVISELQDFVFTKHSLPSGNYSFFATSLENGFLPPNLAALIEYDIPTSAVTKLQRYLKIKTATTENIIWGIGGLTDERLKEMKLLNYEIKKLRNSF